MLLPHHTLSADAVKENLEEYLKSTKSGRPTSNTVATSSKRGSMPHSNESCPPALSFGTHSTTSLLPTQAEDAAADPAKYTKKVEGDHLVVVDDVAIIVEDKAGASALRQGR